MEQLPIRKGPYRGDVSALCLVAGFPCHLLLAGTGSQLLLYDLLTGHLLCSYHVLDGVRVHGVHSGPAICKDKDVPNLVLTFRTSTIVIHGEKRVKLFKILWQLQEEAPQLHLLNCLPRFSYWVMDVRLLQGTEAASESSLGVGAADVMLLAVGLSNNTICIWDLSRSCFIYSVKCSESCLLYSMRLWGHSLETLHAASGTVFNEVLVWKLGCNSSAARNASTFLRESRKSTYCRECQGEKIVAEGDFVLEFAVREEVVDPLQRICGHEGSIHRLTWSSDGLSLVSVSDDRSARVWWTKMKIATDDHNPWLAGVEAGPVLYGHGSRLWDCYYGENLLITASEDCTCRVSTADGKFLTTVKGGHVFEGAFEIYIAYAMSARGLISSGGRGIWRCIYDPGLNVLITAGADSAIKVQSLDKWVTGPSSSESEIDVMLRDDLQQSELQAFSINPLWSTVAGKGPSGFIDSNSEYIRCLALSNPGSLYVCTNQGALYHVHLARSKEVSWTPLIYDLEGPIVCMDVLVEGVMIRGEGLGSQDKTSNEEKVVVGNGRGMVSIVQVRRKEQQWHCEWRYTWVAEKERKLLGVFFCKSMGGKYVFTTDPTGSWCMWHLTRRNVLHKETTKKSSSSSMISLSDDNEVDYADFVAFGKGVPARITCIDVSSVLELLVCGDKQGGLTVFSFSKDLLGRQTDGGEVTTTPEAEAPSRLSIVTSFKGAHGISAVSSVSVLPFKHNGQAEIISTGNDGCICRFRLNQHVTDADALVPRDLICTGLEKVTAVSIVEYVKSCQIPILQEKRRIAAGFTGSYFLLWDLTHQCEVTRIMCGGWRRPHSIFIGDAAELQYCFVFVKDHILQVHRKWVTSSALELDSSLARCSKGARRMTTQSLRGQFHGKEIHTVLFVQSAQELMQCEVPEPSSWIATGSEDGRVLISRYEARYAEDSVEQLESTLTLGDHVGGSAVKALALVTKAHLIDSCEALNFPDTVSRRKDLSFGDNTENIIERQLLFAVGAKKVLTCWLVDWAREIESEKPSHAPSRDPGKSSTSLTQEIVLHKQWTPSFQWLTTQIPAKGVTGWKVAATEDALQVELMHSEGHAMGKISLPEMDDDDDHRYLAVTAFALQCRKTGTIISFVVTASSNATIHLHAFHVTHRSWIELASLDYPTAIVLTLEHVVAPINTYCPGVCDMYIILTGAANGNIGFWDITNSVLEYANTGGVHVANALEVPLRPLTGRGSQGGRVWKRAGKPPDLSPKLDCTDMLPINTNLAADMDLLRRVSDSSSKGEHLPEIDRPSSEEDKRFNCVRPSRKLVRNGLVRPGLSIQSTEMKLSRPSDPLVLNAAQELLAAHQSGVNCISLARVQRARNLPFDWMALLYVVISGGDDQALHMAMFVLQVTASTMSSCTANGDWKDFVQGGMDAEKPKVNRADTKAASAFQVISRSSVPFAHSSAVKGVWTDGLWAFTTGLDQRLRCWRINAQVAGFELSSGSYKVEDSGDTNPLPPLVECMTCVVDVPEASSLNVKDCLGGRYQIAVVGRGLQVINFDSNLLSASWP